MLFELFRKVSLEIHPKAEGGEVCVERIWVITVSTDTNVPVILSFSILYFSYVSSTMGAFENLCQSAKAVILNWGFTAPWGTEIILRVPQGVKHY